MLPNTPTISTLSQTRGYSQSENKVYASDMTAQSAVLLKYSPFIPNTMFYLCFRILKSHLGEIKILNGVKFKANLAGVLLHHTYRFHSHCLWLSLFLATAHLSGSSAENSEHCYGLWQFVWAGISKRNVHNCYSLAFKPDTLLTQSPIHYRSVVHKNWSYETVKHFFWTLTPELCLFIPSFFLWLYLPLQLLLCSKADFTRGTTQCPSSNSHCQRPH